jgi:hypothetical protein
MSSTPTPTISTPQSICAVFIPPSSKPTTGTDLPG